MRHRAGRASRGAIGALALTAAAASAEGPAPDESCRAQSPERCIQSCREKYPRDEHRAERYACFDRAEEPPAPAAAVGPKAGEEARSAGEAVAQAGGAAGTERSPLIRLWSDEPKPISFEPYRQSYLMFTHTDRPNSAPTSPNQIDRVTPTYDLQHEEAKFQFSLKTLAFRDLTFGHGGRTNLWFAYTQQSYWQVFDASHSRPFRESNYEPELILSHPMNQLDASVLGMRPVFLNLGLVHQSNGQSDPRSRSWNRVYAQLALDRAFGDGSSFALLLRPWWRFPEAPETDNNADITHYLGYGDVEALYWSGPYLVSVLARVRSVQLDISRRIPFMSATDQSRALQLHLQLFTGYGESLIDYNQSHTTIGFGLSVPYGL
jgi:phospholipase A1